MNAPGGGWLISHCYKSQLQITRTRIDPSARLGYAGAIVQLRRRPTPRQIVLAAVACLLIALSAPFAIFEVCRRLWGLVSGFFPSLGLW
jgi:hypothetical protein